MTAPLSSLENEGTIVDNEGKTVTIQGTNGTVYAEGDSDYTITTGSYSDTADHVRSNIHPGSEQLSGRKTSRAVKLSNRIQNENLYG